MIDLGKIQKEIYQNKVDKGFNVTDINKEFCLTYGEVSEAYEAWRKKKDDLGEEFADSINQGVEGIMLTGLTSGWQPEQFKSVRTVADVVEVVYGLVNDKN